MIKPIIYHNFEEKEALERKLMAEIPYAEKLAKWNALVAVFAPRVKPVTLLSAKRKNNSK